jgi:hypothetical protein
MERLTPDPKMQRLAHPLLVFVVALILIGVLGLAAGGGLAVLPISVIGAILAVTLEEHRAGRIGEKAFLTVVKESFAQFRFIRVGDKGRA